MDFKLNHTYHLSTEGYSFRYRNDRYNHSTIHVEVFKGEGICHKQMAVSKDYNINFGHHAMIELLEAKIAINELDPTGLKQTI